MASTHTATNGHAKGAPFVKLKRPPPAAQESVAPMPAQAKIMTAHGPVEIEFATITPEIAAKLVEASPLNRPPRQKQVAKIARSMAAGKFYFNGEPVILDDKGALIDGQHRCRACIAAGAPFETLLIRGIRSDAFYTFDQNSIRNAADTLAIRGVDNAKAVAALVRLIAAWRVGYGPWVPALHMSDNFETADVEASVPTVQEHVVVGRAVYTVLGGSAAFYGFMHWLLSHKSQSDADAFFVMLTTGENLHIGHPILTLRNAMLSQKKSRAKSNVTADYYAGFVNAWNAFRGGRDLRQVRGCRGGQVPAII